MTEAIVAEIVMIVIIEMNIATTAAQTFAMIDDMKEKQRESGLVNVAPSLQGCRRKS